MDVLTQLVHLLDATADDRWRPGHPSTRPHASAADRTHDATRPSDPTAEAVCDEARIQFAAQWRASLAYVQSIAAMPREGRAEAIRQTEPVTDYMLHRLDRAHTWWLSGTTVNY